MEQPQQRLVCIAERSPPGRRSSINALEVLNRPRIVVDFDQLGIRQTSTNPAMHILNLKNDVGCRNWRPERDGIEKKHVRRDSRPQGILELQAGKESTNNKRQTNDRSEHLERIKLQFIFWATIIYRTASRTHHKPRERLTQYIVNQQCEIISISVASMAIGEV